MSTIHLTINVEKEEPKKTHTILSGETETEESINGDQERFRIERELQLLRHQGWEDGTPYQIGVINGLLIALKDSRTIRVNDEWLVSPESKRP